MQFLIQPSSPPRPRRRGPALIALGLVVMLLLVLSIATGLLHSTIGPPVTYPHVAAETPLLQVVLDSEKDGFLTFHYECIVSGVYDAVSLRASSSPSTGKHTGTLVAHSVDLPPGQCMNAGEQVGIGSLGGMQSFDTWTVFTLGVEVHPPKRLRADGAVVGESVYIGSSQYSLLPNGTLHAI